jgi:hypothetical protein
MLYVAASSKAFFAYKVSSPTVERARIKGIVNVARFNHNILSTT